MNGERHLQRSVGFVGLLSLCVGINIGGAVFVLLNIAGAATGPSLPLALLVSAVPALLAIVPFRMLAHGYPTTSGTYRYMKLLHPAVAYSVGSGALCAAIVGGQPLFALMTGNYLARLGGPSPTMVAVGLLTALYVLNVLGVRPAVAAQTFMVGVLLTALGLFVVRGAASIDLARFADPFPAGAAGFLTAVVLLYALLAGGLIIIDVGGEVADPQRVFRAVLPLGMGLVLALYVGVAAVAVGAAPWTGLAADGTLVGVAQRFMGSGAMAFFVLGGAVVAGATTVNAVYAFAARAMLVIAQDGLLPAVLARVNPRYGTPHWALTAIWVGAVTVVLTRPSLTVLGVLINLALLAVVGVVSVSATRVPSRYPALYAAAGMPSRRAVRACGYTVAVANALMILALLGADIRAVAFLLLVYTTALLAYRIIDPQPEVIADPAITSTAK